MSIMRSVHAVESNRKIGYNLYIDRWKSERRDGMDKIYAVNEISAIVAPIAETFGIERVWLFGSYARGEASGNSDIDLRIEGGNIRGMFGLGMLYDELTNALSKSVDLVTTEGLNHKANVERTKGFRINMIKDEKLIYESKRY